MARPRKPTALLEMTGAFRKNPSRRKGRAEDLLPAGPLGDPPKEFLKPSSSGTRLLEIWFELIAEAPRKLTVADRKRLEALCRITLETERVGCKPNWFRLQDECMTKLFRITDESRRLMNAPSVQPKDEFEKFMRRKQA